MDDTNLASPLKNNAQIKNFFHYDHHFEVISKSHRYNAGHLEGWHACQVKELPSLVQNLKRKIFHQFLSQMQNFLKVERAGHLTHFLCFCSAGDGI